MGPRAPNKTSSAEWSLGRPGGKERVYCAHPPPRILVLWDSWANVLWGSDFGAQEAYSSGGEPCRIYRAHWDPCVRSFLRVQPEPGTPQRGRRGPGALTPPAWKMAAPGPRGEERERSQVWDSARVPHSPARLGGGEGKLVPGQGSLLLEFQSQKVRNGCRGDTPW